MSKSINKYEQYSIRDELKFDKRLEIVMRLNQLLLIGALALFLTGCATSYTKCKRNAEFLGYGSLEKCVATLDAQNRALATQIQSVDWNDLGYKLGGGTSSSSYSKQPTTNININSNSTPSYYPTTSGGAVNPYSWGL